MNRPPARLSANLFVLIGFAAVGYIDYITGFEIRVGPLYFLPSVVAAIHFGTAGAVAASILGTLVWFFSNYFGGLDYHDWYVWPINISAQAISFFVISLLVSNLRASFLREQLLSREDPLTRLLNRRAFYADANQSLAICSRKKRPATVAFMDLDNFKCVNDRQGHQRGDEALILVAETLSTQLRASDIIARLGGDEFAIFLSEVNEDQAILVLNKIRENLKHSEKFQEYGISVSIGAVVFEEAPTNLDVMLKEADALMYKVKLTGKNGLKTKFIKKPDEISHHAKAH